MPKRDNEARLDWNVVNARLKRCAFLWYPDRQLYGPDRLRARQPMSSQSCPMAFRKAASIFLRWAATAIAIHAAVPSSRVSRFFDAAGRVAHRVGRPVSPRSYGSLLETPTHPEL